MAVVIMLMLAINMTILTNNNVSTANEASAVIIEHVFSAIDKNNKSTAQAIAIFEQDQIAAAKTVAFVLDESTAPDEEELKLLAEVILVDEVNLYDENGRIYASTNSANIGLTLAAIAVIGEFDEMLDDRKHVLFRDLPPEGADARNMAFAMCWRSDGKGMVQVGISKERYESVIHALSIAQIIQNLAIKGGTQVFVAHSSNLEICGTTTGTMIGENIEETGAPVNPISKYGIYNFSASVNGVKSYCAAYDRSDYYVLVAQSRASVNANMIRSTGIMSVYLIAAAVFVAVLVRNMTRRLSEEEERANRDKMTGFYNRRAYDSVMAANIGVPRDSKFAFVAMDINGLKTANDTFGHDAGDELIHGAAECISKAFEAYGKIFRTGGDEFIALLSIAPDELEDRKKHFAKLLEAWTGLTVKSLSVSLGSVTREEFPDKTIREMEKTADERMYRAKEAYYKTQGIDRRQRHTDDPEQTNANSGQ